MNGGELHFTSCPGSDVGGLPGGGRGGALVQSEDSGLHKSPAGCAVCSQRGLQTKGVTLVLAPPLQQEEQPRSGKQKGVTARVRTPPPWQSCRTHTTGPKPSITDLGSNLGLCVIAKPNDPEP